MNLALHGLLLQVILSILDIKHGLCSAGEPGYLDFDNLPETNFSCQGKVIGGYYADVEAGCQMFHVCTIGQKDEIMDIKFLCLNGTVFDQETRVCERVDEVDCSKSERFYNLNLELYGNNAVTLSLQEDDNNDEPPILIDNHHQSSSPRPSTTPPPLSQQTTTNPSLSSTPSPVTYQNSNGYPQHYHPQPPFPSVQTSQSKSHYDDKNGGYHRQYIYHNGDSTLQNPDTNNHNNNNNDNNQATSYQLFSNHHQGGSSTTLTPQQLHHQLSTVSPLYHATSSTLQTLLTGNANNNNNNNRNNHNNNHNNDENNQQLLNALYNNAIVSTTEQFTIHNNNPRETPDYHNNNENIKSNDERRILEPIQSTNQGKISKLTISPVPHDPDKIKHIVDNVPPTIRTFYPTPKTQKSQTSTTRVTQHIHLPPPPPIPQLKPHQVTIHLSPPDIQRIVQNPSPLLPSQSRVIVTAKASVSDESGRPLNTTQLVTLPLPTIPASYDDYKEGDESFDPFYQDVPKIRNGRRSQDDVRVTVVQPRRKRMARSRRDADVDNVDVERRIDSRRFEEDEYREVEDYSTSVESESSREQERDSKFDGDYYDDYSNESKSSDANSLGKANVFDGKESEEYDSREYLFYDEKEMNSTEHLNAESVTEESESVTENPTTMEIEISGLIDSLNNSEDTVVKFTEEIPGSEEKETSHDVKEQVDNPDGLRDYVDDNYEPQSYREGAMTEKDEENVTKSSGEFAEDLESVTSGDGGEDDETVGTTVAVSDLVVTTSPTPSTTEGLTTPSTMTTLTTPSTTTEVTTPTTTTELTTPSTTTELTTPSTTTEVTSPSTTTEVATPSTTMEVTTPSTTTEQTTPSTTTMLTTPSTTSTTPSITTTSTTPSTTISTTPSTTSTTPPTTIASTTAATTSTSTIPSTTVRRRYTAATTPAYKPTAPKLKTFPTRKNYIYIPPTTTPLPVVIKTRLPLYNPKPAKPPRSYNELAPKPIIRKRPLLARRVSSTVNDEDLDSTTTIEPMTTRMIEVLTESVASTTEKTGILSEKLLEKLSETIGEELIEQINDLTTPPSVPDDLVETATSDDSSKLSADSRSDAKAESSINQRLTESSINHSTTTLAGLDVVTSSTIASVLPVNRKPVGAYKRVSGFNCLEKEMYRFYADKRDCRLFHYCSPGFTPRQVLDFRFVCEEGTAFDEVTQNCLHDVKNVKCEKRSW